MAEAAFLAWCQQHGVITHGVQPGYVAAGWRGVLATQNIAPGTEIMCVPQQLLMSVMSAKSDQQLSLVLQHHQLNSNQILAIHLLHEASKGTASFWHPYLQQLPRHFTTLMAWPQQAQQQLQLQHAQQAAAEAVEKARGEWLGARGALQQLGLAKKWCSWQAYCWAASCVLSRTMYHPEDPPCGCLTPLGDLHNYAPPPPPYTPDIVAAARQLAAQQQQQLQGQQQQAGVQFGGQQQGRTNIAQQQQQQQQQQEQGLRVPLQQQQELLSSTDESVPCRQHVGVDCCSSRACTHSSLCSSAAVAGSAAAATAAAAAIETTAGSIGDCSAEASTAAALPEAAAGYAGEVRSAAAAAADAIADATAAGMGDAAEAAVATAAADSIGDGAAAAAGPAAAADATADAALCGDGHYDAAAGAYKIVARRSYSPGEQVFLCYGRHPNLDLLELYGFLLHDNSHDTALLPVQLLQQSLQTVKQQQQGERQWRRQRQQPQQQQGSAVGVELDLCAADCYVHTSGQPSWQLLQALRLAAATPAELKSSSHLAHCGEPISLFSEQLALRSLRAACEAQLVELPTTLAEDEALLSSMTGASAAAAVDAEEGMPAKAAAAAATQAAATGDRQQQEMECLELAVMWRVCYKRALVGCVQLCQTALAALAGSAADGGVQ